METRVAGAGLNVDQMMVTHFRTIPIHATLADAVELLLSGEQREFPVVDNMGRVEGMLTRDNLIKGLSQRGPASTVGEAMTAQVQPVSPRRSGFRRRWSGSGRAACPRSRWWTTAGRLVGLLTLDNITDLLLVRRAQA